MKITKQQLRRIIREELANSKQGLLSERGTGNPALQSEERELMRAAISFYQKYSLTMGVDPSDRTAVERVKNIISDIINTAIGD